MGGYCFYIKFLFGIDEKVLEIVVTVVTVYVLNATKPYALKWVKW